MDKNIEAVKIFWLAIFVTKGYNPWLTRCKKLHNFNANSLLNDISLHLYNFIVGNNNFRYGNFL